MRTDHPDTYINPSSTRVSLILVVLYSSLISHDLYNLPLTPSLLTSLCSVITPTIDRNRRRLGIVLKL